MLQAADLFGAIEWTLATARRTGLALRALDLQVGDAASAVRCMTLSVEADNADLLTLFQHRLCNGVDVAGVQVAGATPPDTMAVVAAAQRRDAIALAAA